MIEFRFATHALHSEQQVIEVWRDGHFIATIYGTADSVRILSSRASLRALDLSTPAMHEIRVALTPHAPDAAPHQHDDDGEDR